MIRNCYRCGGKNNSRKWRNYSITRIMNLIFQMDPLSGMGPMLQGPPTSMMGGGGGAFGGAGGVSSLAGSPFPVSLGATLGGSGTPGSPAKNFGSLPGGGPVSQSQGGFNPMQGLTSQLSGDYIRIACLQ